LSNVPSISMARRRMGRVTGEIVNQWSVVSGQLPWTVWFAGNS
jgi:hypothetical protein